MAGGQPDERGIDGLDPARVDDRDADAALGEQFRGPQADRGHHAHGDQQDVRPLAPGQDVHAAGPLQRRDRRAHRLLGEAQDGGRVVHLDGLAQLGAQLVGVAGCGDPQARDDAED